MRLITLFSPTLQTQIFPAVPQGVILFPEIEGGSAETNRQKQNLNSSQGKKILPDTQKNSALKTSYFFLRV